MEFLRENTEVRWVGFHPLANFPLTNTPAYYSVDENELNKIAGL
jgi:hypothetical protein